MEKCEAHPEMEEESCMVQVRFVTSGGTTARCTNVMEYRRIFWNFRYNGLALNWIKRTPDTLECLEANFGCAVHVLLYNKMFLILRGFMAPGTRYSIGILILRIEQLNIVRCS